MRGMVAESKAESRRTRGFRLDPGMGSVTFVPRPCTVRQAREAWGPPPPAVPLVVEQPGRTQAEAPRHWPGQRVVRQGEGEDSPGRGAAEALRFVGGHARHLAQQQTQA